MPVRGGPHNPSLIDDLTGGLESLLQYYSFERKMEGYNPFILVNVDLCFRIFLRIRKLHVFRGVCPDYYDTT